MFQWQLVKICDVVLDFPFLNSLLSCSDMFVNPPAHTLPVVTVQHLIKMSQFVNVLLCWKVTRCSLMSLEAVCRKSLNFITESESYVWSVERSAERSRVKTLTLCCFAQNYWRVKNKLFVVLLLCGIIKERLAALPPRLKWNLHSWAALGRGHLSLLWTWNGWLNVIHYMCAECWHFNRTPIISYFFRGTKSCTTA